MMHCVANGHSIVALANLQPSKGDELDSFMFQTVGHSILGQMSLALDLPLYRSNLSPGSSLETNLDYDQKEPLDEVETLYLLLLRIMERHPEIEGVSTGAILSTYQRVRVEHVCKRLGLHSITYLWQLDQKLLLNDMIACGVNAILVKVASIGLRKSDLAKSLDVMQPRLLKLAESCHLNVCGEGGEYETITLDCPLFVSQSIQMLNCDVCVATDDDWAPTVYLRDLETQLVDKASTDCVDYMKVLLEIIDCRYPFGLSSEDLAKKLDSVVRDSSCVHLTGFGHFPSSLSNTSSRNNNSKAVHVRKDADGWFSMLNVNITSLPDYQSQPLTLQKEASLILDFISRNLAKHNIGLADIVQVHVQVNDMSMFAELNSAYSHFFGFVNPPTRVTIQTALKWPHIQCQISLFGHSNTHSPTKLSKETLHVQSISYWAPANIGPYSQAKTVHDCITLAGQIGLVPQSMTFPVSQTSLECFLRQAYISLNSTSNILQTLGTDLRSMWLTCVCYILFEEYYMMAYITYLLQQFGIEWSVPVVLVDALPRNASVEWDFTTAFTPKTSAKNNKLTTKCSNKTGFEIECGGDVVKCFVDAYERSVGCSTGRVLELRVCHPSPKVMLSWKASHVTNAIARMLGHFPIDTKYCKTLKCIHDERIEQEWIMDGISEGLECLFIESRMVVDCEFMAVTFVAFEHGIST